MRGGASESVHHVLSACSSQPAYKPLLQLLPAPPTTTIPLTTTLPTTITTSSKQLEPKVLPIWAGVWLEIWAKYEFSIHIYFLLLNVYEFNVFKWLVLPLKHDQ